uniref:Uncharacterized protein n=1 Tax=uncultured prokaryote TaxID=198431 RepID=A0A0H5Q4D1_9ZZZZ|nr:hypothetical protein [uncultured prokaryote]
MSQGSFVGSKYQSDTGDTHFIKVQPETIAATLGGTANAAPTGDIDSVFAAEVNRGARAYGLRPRKVTIAFEDDVPEGYRPYTSISIPVLEPTVFSGIAIRDAVTYAGGTGIVSSKTGENILPGEAVLEAGSGGSAN